MRCQQLQPSLVRSRPDQQRAGWRFIAPGLLCLFALVVTPSLASERLLVFAAASLKNALDVAVEQYSVKHNIEIKLSYASSGTLARQLEQGAPASLVIFAHPRWMDYLQQRDLLLDASRVDLFANRLVLIAPIDSTTSLTPTPGFDLLGALGKGRLAIGDPAHVPAGIYAREALHALGAWDAVQTRTALADNVRSALALVARGEAPLGIVYASDVTAETAVRIAGRFPATTHATIVYPAAVLAASGGSVSPAAQRLLAFLQSRAAAQVFQRYGFRAPS